MNSVGDSTFVFRMLIEFGILGRVCLSVCLPDTGQTITFESLDTGSLYSHIRCISREYGSSSYMKVIGSRSALD